MHVLCTYLNLHHDFVEFNTQSSCFKYRLSCISWHFFPKAPNVSRSSFNGSKSNPHPPRDRGTREEGQVQRSNSWRAVLQMPSMKWWCTWLPCCLFFTVLEPPFFKELRHLCFHPRWLLTMALEGFFLSFTTVDQATQDYQSTWIISTKKGKISKPQSNLGLDLFLWTSMCWSMTVAVIVQENSPHKIYLCLKAHL